MAGGIAHRRPQEEKEKEKRKEKERKGKEKRKEKERKGFSAKAIKRERDETDNTGVPAKPPETLN
jgi:hypothetical protein